MDSDAAISEMRRLAREFGLFVGPSSGAHLLAARELRARYPDLRHVVTFFCDERGEVHQRLLPRHWIRRVMPGTPWLTGLIWPEVHRTWRGIKARGHFPTKQAR